MVSWSKQWMSAGTTIGGQFFQRVVVCRSNSGGQLVQQLVVSFFNEWWSAGPTSDSHLVQ